MKRLLSFLLAVTLVLSCVPAVFAAEQPAEAVAQPKTERSPATKAVSGKYEYEVYDGEAVITGADPSISGDITIPSTLGGYPVVAIDKYAFYACGNITSITISNGIQRLEERSFTGCWAMTTVSIPSSVTYIDNYAFAACDSLTEINVNANNAHYSSQGGLLFNKNKTELIRATHSVSGNYTVPSTVVSISPYAFMSYNITSITIPSSVSSIAADAFVGAGLTAIHVNSGNRYYSSANGVLFNKNKSVLVRVPDQYSGKYTIPSSVTRIGDHAFYSCNYLSGVTIHKGVTSIGEYAFYGCENLTSVTIPGSVTSIGDAAFHSCKKLNSVTIPGKVTSVGAYAFAYCRSLTSVTIPKSVTSIGDGTFFLCYNLTSVTIPGSVTSIGDSAFTGCYLTSVIIPKSVTSIGDGAFAGFDDTLKEIYYTGTASQWYDISIGSANEALTSATRHYIHFPDVKENAWYYNAVEFAVNKGYFSGNDDGTFAPSKNITRQDFVVVLSRIAGANLSKYSGKTGFADVPSNAYYAKAIHWATDNGIISGYNAAKFGVGDPLTREQLVTILSRYAQKKGVNITPDTTALDKMNSYKDASKINPYMKNAIAWALQKKVISGMNGDSIAPQGNATRAQVAAILMNINAYKVIPGI